MRDFSEFVKDNIVKKKKKDTARAKSLIAEAENRKIYVKSIPFSKNNANYIIEGAYDVIRQLVDAKLVSEGYKTSSHDARVSYFQNLNFSKGEVEFLQELKDIRNKIDYYGIINDLDYAEKVLKFLDKIYNRLKELVEV